MKLTVRKAIVIAITCTALAYALKDTPKQKEAKYIRRGNEYFENGEYAKARLEYRNAAKLIPVDAEPAYRMGLVDEAEGDIRNAFANFLHAEEQDKHFHPALLRIANYLLAAEQYDDMQKRLDMVLTDTPGDPEAHALHAAVMLRTKNFADAEAEARQALEKAPENITATSVLAGLYSAEGNVEKAVATVDVGIAHNPKDISLLMLKAKLYESPLNLPKIDEVFHAMFKLQPKNSDFRAALADAYLGASKPDEAERILREGVAELPDNWLMKRRLCDFLGKNRSIEAAENEIMGYMKANPEKDELYFWLADLYLSRQSVDKAVTLLEKIVAKDNNDKQSLNARASLARIHFVKGNMALAEKTLAFVLKKSPNNRDALFIRANISADKGAYQQSVTDLRIILHDKPKDKEALALLGEVFLLQGHVDLAIDTLNQLLDIDPLNSAAKVRLAQMYNLNGDTRRSLDLLAEVTQNDPNYAIGWENMARIAIEQKNVATAKTAIRTLDNIEGQHMTSLFLNGQILDASGDSDEANASYMKVIDADPSSPLAEHAISALIYTSKSPAKLEVVTQYLASLKTDSTYVSTMLGECYITLGKFDLATAALDKAIEKKAVSQAAYIDRAQLYLKDKKIDEALGVLKKADEINPTDARAGMMSADILLDTSKYKEAIDIYSELLRRNPDLEAAANNLAAVIADFEYEDPKQLEHAKEIADKFSGSDNPARLDTLGWIYYRQGKLNEAQDIMSRLAASNTQLSQEMHYHYGVILQKTNNPLKAKEELAKAITGDERFHGFEEAQKLLKSLE